MPQVSILLHLPTIHPFMDVCKEVGRNFKMFFLLSNIQRINNIHTSLIILVTQGLTHNYMYFSESLPYMEEWVDTSSKEEIGCFFINKTTQGMPDLTSDLMSEVKPMAFSDVVIVDGLQMALVVQEECYDPADFSAMFPKDVQLTVVCPINPVSAFLFRTEITTFLRQCFSHYPLPSNIIVCPKGSIVNILGVQFVNERPQYVQTETPFLWFQ